jgi:hypothetical protein
MNQLSSMVVRFINSVDYYIHSMDARADKYVRDKIKEWQISLAGKESKYSNLPKAEETMSIIVQLPPDSETRPIHKFVIPERTNVHQLTDQLTRHFKVDQGRWMLYGRTENGPSHALDKSADLEQYTSDKKARLYFYPEFPL